MLNKRKLGNYSQLHFNELLKGKKISFDVDGVKVDTAALAVKLYNKRFNDNKKKSDLAEFYIITNWIKAFIRNETKATEEAIRIWNDEIVLSKSKPVQGASMVSRLLADSKSVDVHYITSRPGFTRKITLDWFAKWLPWVSGSTIHISKIVDGLQSDFKVETIRNLGIDIHFEDSIEHAEKIVAKVPSVKVILVRQPWNFNVTQESVSKQIVVSDININKPKLISAYEALLTSF